MRSGDLARSGSRKRPSKRRGEALPQGFPTTGRTSLEPTPSRARGCGPRKPFGTARALSQGREIAEKSAQARAPACSNSYIVPVAVGGRSDTLAAKPMITRSNPSVIAWVVTIAFILQTVAQNGIQVCLHHDGSIHLECSSQPCCGPRDVPLARGALLGASGAESCPGCTDFSLSKTDVAPDRAKASATRTLASTNRIALNLAPAPRAFNLSAQALPSTGIHGPCATSPPSSSTSVVLRI